MLGSRFAPIVGNFALAAVAIAAASGGCGSSSSAGYSAPNGSLVTGDASAFGMVGAGDGGTPDCVTSQGWKCAVDSSCTTPTTLTGKVFDPAGLNPLYDVIVFVPNIVSSIPPITPGTSSCNTCDASIGDYVAATTTDATGSFTLTDVPTGGDVPVTVQIGKWRRTTMVNIPTSCQTLSVTDGTLRLPAKQSEGDMPQMAVLTGGCDDLGCFMTGMGIDPSEFTAPHAGGRVDVYQGVGLAGGGGMGGFGGGGGGTGGAATLSSGTAGNCTNASCPLWSTKQDLEHYDMVLLSCECAENRQTKPQTAQQALHDWLDEGGKVFASHYHYTWFEDSPDTDFQGVANWGNTGDNDTAQTTKAAYDIDTTFPKGQIFGQWLGVVGAVDSAGPPPDIQLSPVADSVKTVNAPTQRWIYDSKAPNDVKYLSFETPIGGITPTDGGAESTSPTYCGKAVYTDLHTAGEVQSSVASIPAGCTNKGLSPQQKALEFLFFDLSACVAPDNMAPPPPPPPAQ